MIKKKKHSRTVTYVTGHLGSNLPVPGTAKSMSSEQQRFYGCST